MSTTSETPFSQKRYCDFHFLICVLIQGLQRLAHVKGHELQKGSVIHLREQFLATLDHIPGQISLLGDQGVDLFLHCTTADEFMHQDITLLTNAEGPVC